MCSFAFVHHPPTLLFSSSCVRTFVLQLRRFNSLALSVFGPAGAGYSLLDQHAISLPHINDRMLYNDYVSE